MARKQAHLLYATEGTRIVRRVGRAEGDEKEALGIWEAVFSQYAAGANGQPELIGWRILACRPDESALPSAWSPASISTSEMEINAGVYGESRTVRMGELDRMKREKDGAPAEDHVERVRAKVLVWPHVGSAKGDVLRAWPAGVAG